MVGIRPEAIRIGADGLPVSGWRAGTDGMGRFPGAGAGAFSELSVSVTYLRSEYLGSYYVHHFERDGQRLEVTSPVSLGSAAGANLQLYLPVTRLHFFHAEGAGQRIILLPVFQESRERMADSVR